MEVWTQHLLLLQDRGFDKEPIPLGEKLTPTTDLKRVKLTSEANHFEIALYYQNQASPHKKTHTPDFISTYTLGDGVNLVWLKDHTFILQGHWPADCDYHFKVEKLAIGVVPKIQRMRIEAQQVLLMDETSIANFSLKASQLVNRQKLHTHVADIQVDDLWNKQAKIISAELLKVQASHINNQQGYLCSGGRREVVSEQLNNVQGHVSGLRETVVNIQACLLQGKEGVKLVLSSAGAGFVLGGVQATQDGQLSTRFNHATQGAALGIIGGAVGAYVVPKALTFIYRAKANSIFSPNLRVSNSQIPSFSSGKSAPTFELAARVEDQLFDARLGKLAGKLDKQALNILANNPRAQFSHDSKNNRINIIQKIDDVLFRITVPRDEFKIISVGVVRERNLINSIKNGRFIPISDQLILPLENNIGVKS